MLILILLLFAALGLSDYPALIKAKKKRELRILSILYAAAFTLSVLLVLGITIPSPIKWIQALIIDVLKLGYKP